MKANDFIRVLEYMKAFKDKEPKRRRMKEKDELTLSDILALAEARKREDKVLEKWLEDQTKLMKKEDKKKGWWDEASFLQKLVVLMALTPFLLIVEIVLPLTIVAKLAGLIH